MISFEEQGLDVLVAATAIVASHGSNIYLFLFHMSVDGQVKGRVEGEPKPNKPSFI